MINHSASPEHQKVALGKWLMKIIIIFVFVADNKWFRLHASSIKFTRLWWMDQCYTGLDN